MLSAIERSETSPTAALLVRIAAAFDMTLSTLIAHAEASSGNLARADMQPVWTDPGTGYVRRHLSPRTDMPLELVRVELPVGAHVSLPASSYAFIRQQIWLIEGRLDFSEGATEHKMDPVAGFAEHAALASIVRASCLVVQGDEVAAKAEVNKTTIYRRWPTRGELVTALVERMRQPLNQTPLPDTGALETDLIEAFTRRFKVARQTEGRASTSALAGSRATHCGHAVCRKSR